MELRLSSSAPFINSVYNVELQTHKHSLFHMLTSILVTEFPVIKVETRICAVLTKFKHLFPYNSVHKRKAYLSVLHQVSQVLYRNAI